MAAHRYKVTQSIQLPPLGTAPSRVAEIGDVILLTDEQAAEFLASVPGCVEQVDDGPGGEAEPVPGPTPPNGLAPGEPATPQAEATPEGGVKGGAGQKNSWVGKHDMAENDADTKRVSAIPEALKAEKERQAALKAAKEANPE